MRLPPDTHLERHDQRVARRVPVEIDFGAIDRNARERIVEIDDEALVHQDLAVEHVRECRRARYRRGCAPRAADRARTGSRPTRMASIKILGRDLLRLDVDDAVALLLPGRHGRAHVPRPLDVFRTQRDGDAAALGPRHAEIDIGERPLLAVALVVDREIAAFEADLGEVAAIQAAGVEALDPGQQRRRSRERRCG